MSLSNRTSVVKKSCELAQVFCVAVAIMLLATAAMGESVRVGRLENGAEVLAVEMEDGQWGVAVRGAGLASMVQPRPCQLEVWGAAGYATAKSVGYREIT